VNRCRILGDPAGVLFAGFKFPVLLSASLLPPVSSRCDEVELEFSKAACRELGSAGFF
jgi:hypothetical protein